MGAAVRIAILAVTAPVAAFFSGIAVQAVWAYFEVFMTPWRWSLGDLYRTGGGWIFPGLVWVALMLYLRQPIRPRSQVTLVALFIVATSLSAWAAHVAQTSPRTI